jgi:hypothetical protein
MPPHFAANAAGERNRLACLGERRIWPGAGITSDRGLFRQEVLRSAVQVRAEGWRKQRASLANVLRPGKGRRPENKQRLEILLDALLGVEADRIGWAVRARTERERGSLHRL